MTRPALLLACLLAPAPPFREPPPLDLAPGLYRMEWGGGLEHPLTLTPEGEYRWGGWRGGYAWDRATRTLTVCETCGGGAWHCWSVRLDAEGRGKAEGDWSVEVAVRPAR